jgi:peptidoglycan/xylan/chitin deacetylase (PgdA/CDA1 family)
VTGRRLAAAAGIATAAWVGYAWGAHLATPFYTRRGPRDARRVALTFDDGPDPEWTPRVLDLLGAAGVAATFFVVGERAARVPGVIGRAAAEGHEIANHGWSHRSLWLCGPRATAAEIDRTQRFVADATGRAPRHFRPPWGMVNAAMFAVLRRARMRCVLWSVQPEGLRPRAGAAQAAHVIRHAHPGAIVDLHDADGVPGAPGRLVAALPPLIAGLRAAGYAFATVGDLLAARPPGAAPG